MSSPVETIKNQLSIVDVVSSYIKIDAAGGNWKACCPFHDERTPSFFVSTTKNIYHCFGCGRGGDIFSFVEEIEGVQFKDALRILAERAGVPLDNYKDKLSDDEGELYRLHEIATVFYQKQFMQYKEAFKYLTGRGITKESVVSFRLGFAPPPWDSFVNNARSHGFSDKFLLLSGLAIQGSRGIFDRFRSRIMFPLMNSQGKVVGFSGRIFKVDNAPETKDEPKYMNSPETLIYHKSKFLYGYDKAKMTLQKKNRCVMVEGQMDLILAHQNGISETIALSGTALTAYQVDLIRRFTDRIILALDADQAGIDASSRSVPVALAGDCEVRIATMPQGKDPAEALQKHSEEFRSALDNAEEFTSFRLKTLVQTNMAVADSKKIIEKELYPFIRMYRSSLTQDTALRSIANFLILSHDAVREDFKRWSREHKEEDDKRQGIRDVQPGKKEIQPRGKVVEERIFGIYFWQKKSKEQKIPLESISIDYDAIYGKDAFMRKCKELESTADVLAFSAELFYDAHDATRLLNEVLGLFRSLKLGVLEDTLGPLMRSLRETESRGGDTTEILAQCQSVSKEINELKSSLYK